MKNVKGNFGNVLSLVGKLVMLVGLLFGIMTFPEVLNGLMVVLVGLLINSTGSYMSDGEFGLL